MFEKIETKKLVSIVGQFKKTQEKQQALLTQLMANIIYYSIKDRNIDPGHKLIGALSSNGYNRVNDCITYLCKLGNFKYNKKDGLQYKEQFPVNEEMALEMAEKAISNPMFTIVKEQTVSYDVNIQADFIRFVKAMHSKIKKAAENNGKVEHKEMLEMLDKLVPQV